MYIMFNYYFLKFIRVLQLGIHFMTLFCRKLNESNYTVLRRTTVSKQIRKLYYNNIVRVIPQLGSVPAMLPDLPI